MPTAERIHESNTDSFTPFGDWDSWLLREHVTHDCIDLKRTYIRLTGDLVSGVMLSQIVYHWLPREDGKPKLWVMRQGKYWLPMRHADWAEFGISEFQAASALQRLRDLKLIETKRFRFHGSPTTHIRLIRKGLVSALNALLEADPALAPLWVMPQNPDDDGTPEDSESEPENSGDSREQESLAEEKQEQQPELPVTEKPVTEKRERVAVVEVQFSQKLLESEGVAPQVARRLAEQHPQRVIVEKIRLCDMSSSPIIHRHRWIVAAIRDGYQPNTSRAKGVRDTSPETATPPSPPTPSPFKQRKDALPGHLARAVDKAVATGRDRWEALEQAENQWQAISESLS